MPERCKCGQTIAEGEALGSKPPNKPQALKAHLNERLARVNNIYEAKLAGDKQGRRPVGSTDMLRSAVVFLHATVEEFLRGILEWCLPHQVEQTLNSIPLVGTAPGRPEKFLLGKLAAHRRKTNDALIGESVTSHLTRSNFNSVAEVCAALASVGLDTVPCQPQFAQLTALMEHGHQIVQRADCNPNFGPGHQSATSLGWHTVREWAKAAKAFFDAVYAQLP